MRRVVMGALVLAAVPWGAAQAYWYPYPYYGYGYAPRPVYVAPPYYLPYYAPGYAVPPAYDQTYRGPAYGRVETRRVHHVPVRSAVRPRAMPVRLLPPEPSPFAGPGRQGVVPASTSPLSPFTLVPAPETPVPPQPAVPRAPPPNDAFPPESFTPFRGD